MKKYRLVVMKLLEENCLHDNQRDLKCRLSTIIKSLHGDVAALKLYYGKT